MHGALHGTPERDALRQLMRHRVRHELGVELRPLDLSTLMPTSLPLSWASSSRSLSTPPALADHTARSGRVHRHRDLARLALDVNVGDGAWRAWSQILPDQVVFLQELGKSWRAFSSASASGLMIPERNP